MASESRRPEGALVFAVVSGSAQAKRHLALLCRDLARTLGREVTPKVLPSYAALPKWMESGGAHVAWAPPLVAIDLSRTHDDGKPAIASLALCCTRSGDTGYHAAIFTRHSSKIATLADLEGAHMAWVDTSSSAGYLVPRMRIAAAGLDPAKLFGRQSFLGSHERVACAVLEGDADAGATYLSLDPATGQPMSAGWLEAGAGINGAFLIDTAGPIPSDALVLSNRLSEETRAKVTEALLALPAIAPDPVGALFRADGFAPAERSRYDELAKMADALRKSSAA
ncbi:MAG: PhnD/SsuA/transferrin family substrate-binding protein [Polyangiaceae bacterium]